MTTRDNIAPDEIQALIRNAVAAAIDATALHWYAVETEEGSDGRVAAELSAYEAIKRGVEQVRIPYLVERNRYGNSWVVEQERPLAPYVLVAIKGAPAVRREAMAFVRDIANVVGFLPRGQDPVEIDWLQIAGPLQKEFAHLDAATRRVRRRESRFSVGDTVFVAALDHPVYGRCGKVRKADRGWIDVDFPGAQIPWTLKEDDVKAISRRQVAQIEAA